MFPTETVKIVVLFLKELATSCEVTFGHFSRFEFHSFLFVLLYQE
jgi:hypothetical protein